MALYTHSGAAASDFAVAGTIRQDISDVLLASLVTENNFIGSIDVGAEFGQATLQWVEDALNPQTVTDNTGGGLTSTATTWGVASTADAAVLEVGAIVEDQTIGDFVSGEQMQVTAVSGTTITVTRGYGGTTAVAHPNGNIWRVIERPTYQNSDLGRDLSRPRIPKSNLFQRFERNVNIAQEQILQAKYGYAPGVPDELEYQFRQRRRELLQEFDNAALYSRQAASGSASTGGDYSTTGGLVAWLDGTLNTTCSVYDAAGAVLSDAIINAQNRTITNNGAVLKWVFGGTNLAHTLSLLYKDLVRIVQDDTTRGFKVKEFDTTLQNTLRILWDKQIADTTGKGIMFLLDPDRIRIRPFLESLFYTIQAPSFRDGDAIRMLSKWGFEPRNTGSDSGQAHILVKNLAFSV